MATHVQIGRGALFPNDKGGVDSRPDYRGEITLTIDGDEHKVKLSGWRKQDRKDQTYLSLSLQVEQGNPTVNGSTDGSEQPSEGQSSSTDSSGL